MSADQILGKYLPQVGEGEDLPGLGGIYNPANLGLYTYTHNNPVKLTDPDGNVVWFGIPVAYWLMGGAAVGTAAVATAPPEAREALADGVSQIASNTKRNLRIAAALNPVSIMMAEMQADQASTQERAEARTRDRRNDTYSVRVQVQGKKLKFEGHFPINKDSPVTASEAIEALAGLQSSVPKKDSKLLGDAFQQAEKWIQNVAEQGGVPPIGSTSFTKRGVRGSDARVDVEVLRGPVNLVE